MLHLGILLHWTDIRSSLVNLICCFPCLCHCCLYIFCEILSFNSNPPVKRLPSSFSPILICCLYFHIHGCIHLFPPPIFCFSVKLHFHSSETFPYFLLSSFFSVSSVSISYTWLSPASVLTASTSARLSAPSPALHPPSHCFPSHDG